MKVKTYKALSMTMFQCIVNLEDTIDLVHAHDCLKKEQGNTVEWDIKCIKLHPPGLLHVDIDENEINNGIVIGTLDVKMRLYDSSNISVYFFKDRLKISGGAKSDPRTDEELYTYIRKISTQALSNINYSKNIIEKDNILVNLVNGYMCTGYMIEDFDNFCKKLTQHTIFDKVIMPSYNQIKGRIGSVKLYPFKGIKSSAHFDKGGAIQFFAFRSVDDLHLFADILQQLIHRTRFSENNDRDSR